MAARIFVSCGQRPGAEANFCSQLRAWLSAQGYEVYVAITIQSILDLNHEIIGGLKGCDYYLFINFGRETVSSGTSSWIRGSIYTQQELGIALGEGIEHCLFINQRGVVKEGIHGYLVSNVPEFTDTNDLLGIVQSAIAAAGWTPSYSRQLCLARLRWSDVFPYGDHTGGRFIRVLHGDVRNAKASVAAHGVIARLVRHGPRGGARVPCLDQSTLKASGTMGFEHTIFPLSEAPFDLLALPVGTGGTVMLNSARDIHPRETIVSNPGPHQFEFEVWAEHFSPLRFAVEIDVRDGNLSPFAPTIL